ncbi:alpha/beta fold hydrolase [Zafaria sp. Z1313]|uniref:alpha/beta fold hydrolase n=1 Tax=unclassified Zafaria TaxID=2828765 RepID=UPI002E75C55D|nr:alpha/beta hydrolase [Zafaria sp. J156]MEE1622059.1 alpha/beta hydrolase [Zafaria sp. J156]
MSPWRQRGAPAETPAGTDPARPDPASYPEIHRPRRPRADGRPARTLVFLHGGNVANWMWDPQVKGFADYRVFTPHLPGFGARAAEDWAGLESAADDVAAFVADEIEDGRVHLVGLSLGAVVGLRVLARHPELVESAVFSGAAVRPVGPGVRVAAAAQLRFWDAEWFWKMQAGAFGIPADSRRLYSDHGLTLRPENMKAMMEEVYAGGVPGGLADFAGRLLVVAGAKEPSVVRKGFAEIAQAKPDAVFRLAPGMHHQWSIEDPLFFNAMVRAWIERGEAHPRLREP